MGQEILPAFGDTDGDDDWRAVQMAMAKAYLLGMCGDPPTGYELEETSHECDMGGVGDVASYTMLSITWEAPCDMDEEGWAYYHKCEEALERLETAVCWPDLRPEAAA